MQQTKKMSNSVKKPLNSKLFILMYVEVTAKTPSDKFRKKKKSPKAKLPHSHVSVSIPHIYPPSVLAIDPFLKHCFDLLP